jgi:plastocyanin
MDNNMPSTSSPTQDNKPDHDAPVIRVVTSNPEQQHYIATSSYPSPSKKTYRFAAVILLLLVGIGIYGLSSGNKTAVHNGTASLVAAVPIQVRITSTGFVPATVSIKVGQAVTWVNTDIAPHIVASDPYPTDNTLAGFDPKQDLSTNDRYGFVFDKAGTYTYHDDLNPYTLRGTVIVKQ